MAFYVNRLNVGRGCGLGRGRESSSNGFNYKACGFIPASQNNASNSISNSQSGFTHVNYDHNKVL